jgi:hypothetical protein
MNIENNYASKYIDKCQQQISAQLSAYSNLISKLNGQTALASIEIYNFENLFFNNLVLALDSLFSNRSRSLEKKDGNALNEVRVLCNSIINHNAEFTPDTTIKLNSETSILKYSAGQKIKLNQKDFASLSEGFFQEIKLKYS